MAHGPALAAATTPVNRHIRGETNEIMLRKKGSIAINTGDLIFVDAVTNSTCTNAAASHLAFPASHARNNNPMVFEINFAGVAMSGSPSGVTEEIPVATTGIFRYPVSTAAGKACSPGYIVSGASYGAGGVSVFSQKVNVGPTLSLGRIGYCVRAQGAATEVDVSIMGRFSGATRYRWVA